MSMTCESDGVWRCRLQARFVVTFKTRTLALCGRHAGQWITTAERWKRWRGLANRALAWVRLRFGRITRNWTDFTVQAIPLSRIRQK
jgi:hypothetical protein